jgi:hypothetical protein
MGKNELDDVVQHVSQDLSYVIRMVGERGFSGSEEEADDYGVLLTRKEFRELVVAEIYEQYFLPERHEFDWQILHELALVLTSEKLRTFMISAVAAGILGNGAFAMLRAVLNRILTDMKVASLPAGRKAPYVEMKEVLNKIERYFQENAYGRISAIELYTEFPREKIYPLLKLLGFSHQRRKHNCLWCRPGIAIEDPADKPNGLPPG